MLLVSAKYEFPDLADASYKNAYIYFILFIYLFILQECIQCCSVHFVVIAQL